MGLYPILSLFSCVVHHGTTQRSKWSDKFPWSPLPPALPYPPADSELNHWWLLAWHLTQKKATSWAKKGNHFQLHAITSVHCSYMHRWWPGAHGLQNLAKILKTRTHTCPHWTALVPLRFGSLQHVLLCFCEWPVKACKWEQATKIQQRLWVKGGCTWECFGYWTFNIPPMPDCQIYWAKAPREGPCLW